jgi:hypothetical protein
MTDNTMVKRIRSKEQTNHCLFFWSYSCDHCVVCHCKSLFVLLTIVLSVIVNHCLFFWSYSFDHCVFCHCKSLFDGQKNKIKRTNNDLQWQTTQWSKEQTMIYNDGQHNGQKNNIKWTNNDLQWQTKQWSKEYIVLSVIVNHCLFFWSYSFDHCVVCHCKSLFILLILFFSPLCCPSLYIIVCSFDLILLTIVLYLQWQTTQWSKE